MHIAIACTNRRHEHNFRIALISFKNYSDKINHQTYSASSFEATFVVFLLLIMFFLCKNVIMEAIVLKSELLVNTSFIYLFFNCGTSSLNGYVVDRMTGYHEISVA